jgi:peptidoglycan/LPS O-acetylase OafA/YrhL
MEKIKARTITGSSSVFLDCVRIGAAFTVLYIHAFDRWFPLSVHDPAKPAEPSHAAVIVFFVLSGYVIAHTTISKNRGGMEYAQSRLTRLSSVVIPVLLITAIIQFIIGSLNPIMLLSYSRGFSIIRYILSALFINECWFFSAAPPLNGSLWSLSFEFWYYTIFGLWFFRKTGWKSYIIVFVACLFAGPKIILMMPVWLSGYIAYCLPKPFYNLSKAWLFLFICLFLGWLAVSFVPHIPYIIGYKPLYYANQFITDWVVGIFIAAALWILPTGNSLSKSNKWANRFRGIADLTFPIYVLHFPLLVLYRCLFGYKMNNVVQMWQAIISVIVISSIIGLLLEKQRPLWNKLFKWILSRIKNVVMKNKTAEDIITNVV